MAARMFLAWQAAIAAGLATSWTPARAAAPECSLYNALKATKPAIQLARVMGTGHVAVTLGDVVPGKTSPYLVPGDEVLVLNTDVTRLCVAFTAPTKTARTTVGWIASGSLAAESPGPETAADWIGEWHSGPEQTVTFKLNGRQLHVRGDATYGATDPERVKRGGVNIGALDGQISPSGGHAEYSEGDTTACHVKFWKLGPYLVASDNDNCGGHNVSFSGTYRRVAGRPS